MAARRADHQDRRPPARTLAGKSAAVRVCRNCPNCRKSTSGSFCSFGTSENGEMRGFVNSWRAGMQPITKAEFDAVVPLASLELKSCRTYRMSPAGDMQHV